MKQYLQMMRHIMEDGVLTEDRTGVGRKRIPGYQMVFDMKDGFPIVTSKLTSFRLFTEEMLWMIKGKMDLRSLLEKDVHIWTEWAFESWVVSIDYDGVPFPENWRLIKDTPEFAPVFQTEMRRFEELVITDDYISKTYGDFKPMYGYQWRHWLGVNPFTLEVEEMDQLQWAIDEIKNNPNSARITVSAWNTNQVKYMKLPPCHREFQFICIDGELSLVMDQRSCDSFLGVPFNIGEYAVLLHIVANITGTAPRYLVHNLNDVHIYANQFEQVKELLSREPLPLPQLKIKRKFKSIDDNITIDDFELVGYQHQGKIKAPVAI